MKRLSVLGSTGSIGCNTLEVVRQFPQCFEVKALTGARNIDRLCEQIQAFSPDIAAVLTEELADRLEKKLPPGNSCRILYGAEGYRAAATLQGVDTVVAAMVGAAGLEPTLAAIDSGKDIALANKETLVMAGDLVIQRAEKAGVAILPVDSEHSAIFQCLKGNRRDDLDKILLTGSGGPFRTWPIDRFGAIRVEDALNHPNWQMGNKITVDSATLMNKGLEVLEAKCLFQVSLDDIQVIIHPQSVVHSMVSFVDGSVIAQLGIPDMRGAIAYALSCPERLPLKLPVPAFADMGALTFEAPDTSKFPCLSLAFQAGAIGGTAPAVLNAANEVAVGAFLNRRLAFTTIPAIIEKTLERHAVNLQPEIVDIFDADRWARAEAAALLEKSQD